MTHRPKRAQQCGAQADFEKAQDKLEALRESRRKSFEDAQAAGLSMPEIADETGLHFTRVAQASTSQ